jgi:hypothetical protein
MSAFYFIEDVIFITKQVINFCFWFVKNQTIWGFYWVVLFGRQVWIEVSESELDRYCLTKTHRKLVQR